MRASDIGWGMGALAGVGAYNMYSAVGKQPLSNKKTLPVVGFSKGTRDATKKVGKESGLYAACVYLPGAM